MSAPTPEQDEVAPGSVPDFRHLAETYWSTFTTADPMYQGGPFPLDGFPTDVIEAMKAGVRAVVADALPSVALLDDALRKACDQRDKLRAELKETDADHAGFLDELLLNSGGEPEISETPEDLAVGYVRGLEVETACLTDLVRQALDDAGVDEDTKAEWLERHGLAYTDPSTQELAYAEDREADEIAAEDEAEFLADAASLDTDFKDGR